MAAPDIAAEPQRDPRRGRAPSLVWVASAAAGALIALRSLATRPDCPDGYVRLIDVMPVMPGIFGLLGVAGLAVLVFASGRARVAGSVVGLVLTWICVAVTIIAAGSTAAGADCWTF